MNFIFTHFTSSIETIYILFTYIFNNIIRRFHLFRCVLYMYKIAKDDEEFFNNSKYANETTKDFIIM